MLKRYLILCDNVIKDIHTNSLSCINIRNGFILESFPSSIANFFVAAGFRVKSICSNVSEQINSQLKIISPENKIILDLKQSFILKHHEKERLPGVDFIFKIDKLVCEVNGVYRVQVLEYEKELILAETDFEVEFPEKPEIRYKSAEEISCILKNKDTIRKVESAVVCPKCKYEKTFTLVLHHDLYKNLEQEMSFPKNLIYCCENCGQWKIHLGRMMVFMHSKLGQPVFNNPTGFDI